jgi:hypothetical protein
MPEPEPIQPASTQVLDTEFKLAFDPALAQDPVIRKIFERQSSKALWLFLRRDHLASQHFNGCILDAALVFEALQPDTLEEFKTIFICQEDGAVREPWSARYGDEEANRQRNAKLSFLMEAMYGRIPLRVHTGLLQK